LAENNIITSKELPTKSTSQVLNKPDLKGFSIMHLNIASLTKHIDQLRINLIDKRCHILSVNETRLSDDINNGFVKIDGYEIFRAVRNRGGGGVFLYIKTAINANLRQDLIPVGLEVICLEIKRTKSKPLFSLLVGIDHQIVRLRFSTYLK
jgi:hypothetical protein